MDMPEIELKAKLTGRLDSRGERCRECGAFGFHACSALQAQREAHRLAREFWERAALQAFRDGVWPQDDTKALPMLASIAVQADFLTAEWRKRFDPKEAMATSGQRCRACGWNLAGLPQHAEQCPLRSEPA